MWCSKSFFRSFFKNLRYPIQNFDLNTREAFHFDIEARFCSLNVQRLSHVYCKYERQKFERRVSKYYPEQCFYLTDRNMEQIVDLQRMIDKKKTRFRLFIWVRPVLPETKFVRGALEDCPVWDKICKIVTNHPHSLSVGQWQKICIVDRR